MESLFAKTKFQVFLFCGGAIVAIAKLVRPENDAIAIYGIVAISIFAIIAFMFHIFLLATNAAYRAQDETFQRTLTTTAWPSPYDVKVARGFMIFGLLIYLGYHFLDGFVITGPEKQRVVNQLLDIRVGVSMLIGLFWAISFSDWFRRHYVGAITFAVTVAGIGVGAMLYFVGSEIQFYYEGFIQVIAFAAFAFRLPLKPLVFICFLMFFLYFGVSVSQLWPGSSFNPGERQQAEFANNVVALLTFIVLALIASSTLHPLKRGRSHP